MTSPPADHFRLLFEHAPDGMLVLDDHGRCTDVNDAMCELLGVKASRIVGLHYREIVAPAQEGDAKAAFEDLLVRGATRIDFPVRREGGGFVDIEWHARADVAPGRHLGVARDVTAERRHERLVMARAEISRALFANGELDAALPAILPELCRAARGSFAAFWRPRPDGRRLKLAQAFLAHDAEDLRLLEQTSRRIELGPAEGLPGTAWAAGGPVVISEVGHSALIPRAGVLLAAGMRTGVGVPVLCDGPLGVFEVFTDRDVSLGEPERVLLESIATLVSDHERRRRDRAARDAVTRERVARLREEIAAVLAPPGVPAADAARRVEGLVAELSRLASEPRA